MQISVRINSCRDDMGEATIDTGYSKITFDYDRDEFAHQLVNAFLDLYGSGGRGEAMRYLSTYLDADDVQAITA
jgi:hypothetical protein